MYGNSALGFYMCGKVNLIVQNYIQENTRLKKKVKF